MITLARTEEQRMLQEGVAALLATRCRPDDVRASENLGFMPSLWAYLVTMGAVDMVADESAASLRDLAVVVAEVGAAIAPLPISETFVALRALRRLSPATAAVAADEARRAPIAFGPEEITGGSYRVVPGAAVARRALVLRDGSVVLMPLDLLDRRRVLDTAGESLGMVAATDPGAELTSGAAAAAAHRQARDEWLVLQAGKLWGLARTVLALGAQYVNERRQFGVPIGSYQAVAHRLADCAAAVDAAGLLVDAAIWASDSDDRRAGELAAMSFAQAADTAQMVTYWVLHFHGGYGFMEEYDVQLYFRRAQAWGNLLGGAAARYGLIADARYSAAVVAA